MTKWLTGVASILGLVCLYVLNTVNSNYHIVLGISLVQMFARKPKTLY